MKPVGSSAFPAPASWRQGALDAVPLPLRIILALAALLVLTPIVSLLLKASEGDAEIWPHLAADVLPYALRDTALLLSGVALLAGFIGIATAWCVTTYRFHGRDALAWLLPLPLAMPTYITAYVAVEIFDAAGPVQGAFRDLFGFASRTDYWFPEIRSLPGCILVMSFVLYPYVYLTARAMFLTQSASMAEVAKTLGASPLALFRTVGVPLARPALAIGLSLALLESLNDIGASEYLGVRTLTVAVFTTWLNRGSLPGAAQIACLMLVFVIAFVLLERRARSERRYFSSASSPRTMRPTPVGGLRSLLMTLGCTLPVLLGFALPAGFLAEQILARGLLDQADASFLKHLASTILLSGVATFAALGLAACIVVTARLQKTGVIRLAKTVIGLGYALPGTLLALGLFAPLVKIDEGLNFVWQATTGQRLGLLLMGSSGGIVIAYVIRFLPIASGALEAGMERVSPRLEDAARILGARPAEVIRQIQWPLLKPAFMSAALLVFVDCLKELPATLLLRPLNLETLATLVYGHAARGQFEDGALAALLIVLVGILPIVQLTKHAEKALGKNRIP